MAKLIFFFLTLLLTVSFNKPASLHAEEGVDEEEVKSTISSDPDHRPPRKKTAAPATPAPADLSKATASPARKSPASALPKDIKPKDTVSGDIVINDKERKIVTKKISFAPDADILAPPSEKILKDLSLFLKNKPDLAIRIEVHTDSLGSDQKNRDLSQQRSDRIRRFLITEGIQEQRLESIGVGDKYPVASDVTPEGQEKNRRVNFVLLSSSAPESLPMPSVSQMPIPFPVALETQPNPAPLAPPAPSIASEPALPPGIVPQAAISAPVSAPPETAPAAPLPAVSAPVMPPATQPATLPMSPETVPVS